MQADERRTVGPISTKRYDYGICFLFLFPCLDPSNINILETPTTPEGKRCPQYWESFGDSCYLLRNQVRVFSPEYMKKV
jgi:hypothetical protein